MPRSASAVAKSRPWPGMNFEAEFAARAARAVDDALPLGLRGRGVVGTARRTRRRCGSRSTGAPIALRPRSARGSAAMNSDTRIPLPRARLTPGASASRWPATSSPPSVVRSSRRSGTRQAACGRCASAIATISSVAAISRLSGLSISRLQPRDVVVADVATILAQMRGDAVGAGRDRDLGGLNRIRMPPAARIADGGDMVDVDAEAEVRSRHFLPSDHAPAICLPAGPVSSRIAGGNSRRNRSRGQADRGRMI